MAALRRIVESVVSAWPMRAASARAIDATLADWRHEEAGASGRWRRVSVSTRGLFATARVTSLAAWREAVSEVPHPFLIRLVFGLVLLGVASRLMADPWHWRYLQVATPLQMSLLQVSMAVVPVVTWFPAVVFFAEVTGRRQRSGFALGHALWVMVAVALLWMVVVPEAQNYVNWLNWHYFANSSTPAPRALPSVLRIGGALGADVSWTMWLWLPILSVVMTSICICQAVLASAVRRAGTVRAWAAAIVLFLLAYGLTLGMSWAAFLEASRGIRLSPAWAILAWAVRILAFLIITVGAWKLAARLTRTHGLNARESSPS